MLLEDVNAALESSGSFSGRNRSRILYDKRKTVLQAVQKKRNPSPNPVFGKTQDGTEIELYTLHNAKGASAKVMTFGATLVDLDMPDRTGKMGDVVLGFDNLKQYLGKTPFFGVTVGRYANRIAKGKFTLDGKEYTLAMNNGPNSLHGGIAGFDHKVWTAEQRIVRPANRCGLPMSARTAKKAIRER